MRYIFGPVRSRRLGFSLGVDIVPHKVCSLDCVYCQVGKTSTKTIERKEWVPFAHVCNDLEKAILQYENIDYITFSGSGEPTLNSCIGKIISRLKQNCSIPVAVITNGTLLYRSDVRDDLMEADLVIPSLDAVSERIFSALNRPHPELNTKKIVEGIKAFRKDFSGNIWLEVMIVRGINDTREELALIANEVKDINVDKIHLNTVVRLPADKGVEPAGRDIIEYAQDLFGEKSLPIQDVLSKGAGFSIADVRETIFQLLKRRACSPEEIEASLDIPRSVVSENIEMMIREGVVREIETRNEKKYKAF